MKSKLLIFPFILINFFIFSYQKEILTEELTWKVHESKTLKLEISDNFHKRFFNTSIKNSNDIFLLRKFLFKSIEE